MNFDLGPDERALQEGIRELCRGRFPMERIRGPETSGTVDRDAWHALAGAGVFSLRLPEAEGGVGLGMTEAVLVFEELGRALVPGPVVGTHLAAGSVQGAAAGDRVVGLAVREERPLLVEHLEALDDLVVLDDSGVWKVDRAAIDSTPVGAPFDPLTPLGLVTDLPAGEQIGHAELASQWRVDAAVLTAAQLVGIAHAVTDLSVAYAKERRQFGRPIGSFQAVKHILADMLVRAEVARAAVHAAGLSLDGRAEVEPERAVAAAKLLASEAGVANGKAAVQVHGGMGYTWEVDVHLYLKRAAVLAASFGGVDELAASMAAFL